MAAGYKVRGRRAEHLHATLRLALDVFTWRRLRSEGLDDAGAAELMAHLSACLSNGS